MARIRTTVISVCCASMVHSTLNPHFGSSVMTLQLVAHHNNKIKELQEQLDACLVQAEEFHGSLADEAAERIQPMHRKEERQRLAVRR